MAKSFSAYASQFLNKQQNGGTSSLSSSQPMFFSFTTDNGSRAGRNPDSDLDDLDDPHLRADDDDDPYLRLDEGYQPGSSRHGSQSIPLVASEPGSPKGWLAHQVSPMRSPSPSSSSSSETTPPLDFRVLNQAQFQPPPPPTTRGPISLSLTESLLPQDGRPVDVFSLPDPRHNPRVRRKHNDSIWTAIWCTGVSVCLVSSILALFLIRDPSDPTKNRRVQLPYTTLLHTVPLLTILTFLSALVAYGHIFVLSIFVRPVMIATSVFIPATLLFSALWAFIGSFMWEAGVEPTWGETIGLRIFSLVPLVLSFITARRLIDLPREIHTTSAMLNLTTRLLIANPFLLGLSPAVLLVTLLLSIPFLTLIFRLLLIGTFYHPPGTAPWEWHAQRWAHWAIAGTAGVWLWTWGVARGVLRMTCAGVIGAWYFADPSDLPPPPTSTHTIHAALFRATAPSLGTTVLSAFLLTGIRALSLLTLFLRRLPLYLPIYLRPLAAASMLAVGMLEGVTTSLSRFALVYAGLTGDPFMPSARRARALTAEVEARARVGYRRRFKTEPPLTLLTVAPLTLTFPFALVTYLFVAHTLEAPDQALGAAILAGGVTALVGLFCVGLVTDTADTLYICYCIDKDLGEHRREEVFSAFEYENRPRANAARQVPSPRQHSSRGEESRPRPSKQNQERQPSHQHRQDLPSRSQPLLRSPLQSPLQLSPPLDAEADADIEDVNPFEVSYLDDNTQFGGHRSPPSSSRSRSHSRHIRTPPHSQTLFSPPYSPLVSATMSPTSTELNRKPVETEALQPYSVDREEGEDNENGDGDDRDRGVENREEDGDGDGSQFFPGSGFF